MAARSAVARALRVSEGPTAPVPTRVSVVSAVSCRSRSWALSSARRASATVASRRVTCASVSALSAPVLARRTTPITAAALTSSTVMVTVWVSPRPGRPARGKLAAKASTTTRPAGIAARARQARGTVATHREPTVATQPEPSSILSTGTIRALARHSRAVSTTSVAMSGDVRPRVNPTAANTPTHSPYPTMAGTSQPPWTGAIAASAAIGAPTTNRPTRSATAMRATVC